MYNRRGSTSQRGYSFSMGPSSSNPPSANFVRATTPAAFTGQYSNTFHGYESYAGQKRRPKTEEEYFEGGDEREEPVSCESDDLEYMPAPGSPANQEEEEEDPLDAFMAGIEEKVEDEQKELEEKLEREKKQKLAKQQKKRQAERTDLEAEDAQESYFRYMEENPEAGMNTIALLDEDEVELEYDVDGNPIVPERNKVIDPLPPVDHGSLSYEPFEKNFYVEHEDIARLTPADVLSHRGRLGIRVMGANPPPPSLSFAHFNFDERLMNSIRKSEFTQPTPIQAQAIPAALSGRDVIGIAKTGSGKTAAYLWPLLVHIMDQRELCPGDGPIGLILAPTRELSVQIYGECKKFGKVYNLKVVCAYGGGNMYEQGKGCEEGCEVVVATPGRLIDLIRKKNTNLRRVTYLVFDEADRMFDMGFEAQVRSLANHVRPDRQTLLFSATFKRKVERLCRDILTDPVKIVQGELGEANEDIRQIIHLFPSDCGERFVWLKGRLPDLESQGSVLVFVGKKLHCDELTQNLKRHDFNVGVIHGDMNQAERNDVITSYRKGHIKTLVATDVAARGLDIPSIRNVVNYDVARDIDTHTHRIGRTGRAGEKGTAYTLVTDKDKEVAGHLVRNLEAANQLVPDDLMQLALQSQWFKNSRFKQGKGRRAGGGKGLGFKVRPGLGAPNPKAGGESMQQTYTQMGPGTDRLSAVKAAFKSQYMSNFHSASSADTGKVEQPAPQSSSQRRKKSRWE